MAVPRINEGCFYPLLSAVRVRFLYLRYFQVEVRHFITASHFTVFNLLHVIYQYIWSIYFLIFTNIIIPFDLSKRKRLFPLLCYAVSTLFLISLLNEKFTDSFDRKISISKDDAKSRVYSVVSFNRSIHSIVWPKKEQTCFVCNLINIGGKSFLLHNEGEMDERERETSLPSDFGLFYFRSRGRGYSLPGFLIHYRLVLLICKSPKGFSLLWFGKQKTVDWNSLVVSWLSSIGFNVILR